jgi:hypothetical protein
MAGGGFKSGLAYGETDEFGYKAVTNRVGVPTCRQRSCTCLGIDHDQLRYPYHGIDETPTDAKVNGAKVVAELLKSSSRV